MKKYKGLILLLLIVLICILTYVGLILCSNSIGLDLFLCLLFHILGVVLAIPLFVITHEAGHLVFGLISGYKVLSFKVGPFEWYSKDETVKFRVNSFSTMVLGQCLMTPPKHKKKEKPKFILYNAGGLIFSYLFDVLVVILFLETTNYIKQLFIPIIVISLFFTINNSIYQKGGINDVCNYVVVKNNPKYIHSILYQLEMLSNIVKGKRYGAKTQYEPFFEDRLNHISLPVAQLKFLQVLDKDDLNEVKRIGEVLKKNYHNILLPAQRVSIIFLILYLDIVIDKNMHLFKRHFKWIGEKEKLLCTKLDYDIKYYYNIYKDIYNGNYDIIGKVEEMLESDSLMMGERLSVKKMYYNLIETLKFYKENGNSFIVKEVIKNEIF